MRLYLVRHGKAVETATDASGAPSDFHRILAPKGHEQAQFLAAKLAGVERRLKFIVASRFPRAIATAQILHESIAGTLLTDGRIEVDHEVSEALEIIHEHAQQRALMLVAHNPQLGELLSVLCSNLPASEQLVRTGELIALDVRPSQPVGTSKLIGRLRLDDAQSASTESVLGLPTPITRR